MLGLNFWSNEKITGKLHFDNGSLLALLYSFTICLLHFFFSFSLLSLDCPIKSHTHTPSLCAIHFHIEINRVKSGLNLKWHGTEKVWFIQDKNYFKKVTGNLTNYFFFIVAMLLLWLRRKCGESMLLFFNKQMAEAFFTLLEDRGGETIARVLLIGRRKSKDTKCKQWWDKVMESPDN